MKLKAYTHIFLCTASSCHCWHLLWVCSIKFYNFLSISGTILYHSVASSFPLLLAVHPLECLLYSGDDLVPASHGERDKKRICTLNKKQWYNNIGKEADVLKIFIPSTKLHLRRAEFSQNIKKLQLYDKEPPRKITSLSLSQKLLGY